MKNKTTLIIGASQNPDRYSYLAIHRLQQHGNKVYAIGNKAGEVSGVKIITEKKEFADVHTVTIYLNPANQKEYYDYLLTLKPERIIFNPGAENPEFEKILSDRGFEVLKACTLVMLSIGAY